MIHIILIVISLSSVLLKVSGQELFQIGFGGVRWRRNCDMTGPDLHSKRGPAEKCGTFCKDKRYLNIYHITTTLLDINTYSIFKKGTAMCLLGRIRMAGPAG